MLFLREYNISVGCKGLMEVCNTVLDIINYVKYNTQI